MVLDRLLEAHEIIIEKVRAGLDKTEESKDWGSNDLLMGDVLRRQCGRIAAIARIVDHDHVVGRGRDHIGIDILQLIAPALGRAQRGRRR